jgi:hypothetical protein
MNVGGDSRRGRPPSEARQFMDSKPKHKPVCWSEKYLAQKYPA